MKLEEPFENILKIITNGNNLHFPSKTPLRAAEALAFMTSGYTMTPKGVVGEAVYQAESTSMVSLYDISYHSLCEHHLLPFSGVVHIAYTPDKKIVGLSKLARIVDVFARRLQLQERLTSQIAEAINELLSPKGVAVLATGQHSCMQIRGVQKQGSTMKTECYLGAFEEQPAIRSEFLAKL